MERKYTYKNGTVYVSGITKKSIENIKVRTEEFLTKLMKEQNNGNRN